MKDSTIVILVIGGFAVLYLAFSRGFLSASPTGLGLNPATGQAYGTINVPQPSTNYSGYLAASTAPGVSSALNGALSGIGSGLNNLFSGWFGGSSQTPTAANQTATPASPSLGAQPAGPNYGPFLDATMLQGTSNPVGPVNNPDLAYAATSGLAFDYAGLANANSPDSTYSLMDPSLASA
jgi:hypothetical protein